MSPEIAMLALVGLHAFGVAWLIWRMRRMEEFIDLTPLEARNAIVIAENALPEIYTTLRRTASLLQESIDAAVALRKAVDEMAEPKKTAKEG